MSRMGGRRLAEAAPVVSGLLLAATGVAALTLPLPAHQVVGELLPNAVLALVLPLLGAAVLARAPRSPLGRLWVLTGLAGALTLAVHTYARLAVELHPGDLPLAAASAWLSAWLWVLATTPLLAYGLLVFPDGRLPSRRWRPALVPAVGAVVLPVLGQALAPGPLDGLPLDNPLGVAGLEGLTARARELGFLCFTAGVAAGAAALAVRWRRGTALERSQLALPALAAGVLGATFVAAALEPRALLLDVLLLLELIVLLAAFGVAVLRDRAAGVEVVLRRSLTYGLLTGAVAVTYLAAVALLSLALPARGAGLVGSLGAALLALPLRDRLQRQVDRALYGDRHDPLTALGRLGGRLEAAAEPEALLDDVAEVIASSLRLPCVQVVLEQDGRDVVAGASGAAPSSALVRLPLSAHGAVVGALLVAPRSGETALGGRDLAVLDALRRQAAPAVAAVRLAAELRLSRQRLVAAREEERRRLRRDLHDGLGPTLAGIGLGLQVAAGSDDPVAVRALVQELIAEASAAVLDVRRLVEDLRPPALDELGLVGALQQHAERLGLRNGTEVAVRAATELADLPAAVEVAAYRIAMEALTNALRHGAPSRCELVLRLDDALHLEVTDDGVGLPPDPPCGVGLAAMRERAAELGGVCTVSRPAAGGTSVRARLPVQRS
jgi:signal transduction histidine kinase